jgi:hypothetical protein
VPDIPLSELLQTQRDSETQVTFAQIWGSFQFNLQNFITNYVPLVTGSEDPITQGDPDYIFQFGLEVSQFDADQFGHYHCAGISNAMFPFDAKYSKPIFEFCRAQANAVTGYAHVLWPHSYDPEEIVFNPNIGGIGYLASTDTALGLVDFIETSSIHSTTPIADWRGMYYKLLNTGLRPSLSAGRDNTCALPPWNDTTFVRTESEPLTFTKWTAALKAGRTTIAEGKRFLNLTVNGTEIGGTVSLVSPSTVDVSVTYTTADPQDGELYIVRDGIALPATYPYALLAGEVASFTVPVQMDKSGWVAVHAQGFDESDAHTGPTYVIVENQPICNAPEAGYWSDYSEAFINNLSLFNFDTQAELDEVAAHIVKGKKVFDALEACALPPPVGVARYGVSGPACKGPIQVNVRDVPTIGNPNFAITNINAPANAPGWLVVGTAPTSRGPLFAKGAELFIDPGTILLMQPVTANSGGYHEFPIQFPPNASGATLYFQYFWQNVPGCGSVAGGALSSSDAIGVTVQ